MDKGERKGCPGPTWGAWYIYNAKDQHHNTEDMRQDETICCAMSYHQEMHLTLSHTQP